MNTYINRIRLLTLPLIFAWISSHAEIPIEEFAQLPAFDGPRLSPDASKIAATMIKGDEELLYLFNFQPDGEVMLQSLRKISKSQKLFFQNYRWTNNDVLISEIRSTVYWHNNLWNATRLLLIPASQKELHFIDVEKNYWGQPKQHSELISTLPEDDKHILVSVDIAEKGQKYAPEVDRVNVYTGKKHRVQKSTKNIHDWIADNNGNIRIGIAYRKLKTDTNINIYYRDIGGSWEPLQKSKYLEKDHLYPARFSPTDNNILLV